MLLVKERVSSTRGLDVCNGLHLEMIFNFSIIKLPPKDAYKVFLSSLLKLNILSLMDAKQPPFGSGSLPAFQTLLQD